MDPQSLGWLFAVGLYGTIKGWNVISLLPPKPRTQSIGDVKPYMVLEPYWPALRRQARNPESVPETHHHFKKVCVHDMPVCVGAYRIDPPPPNVSNLSCPNSSHATSLKSSIISTNPRPYIPNHGRHLEGTICETLRFVAPLHGLQFAEQPGFFFRAEVVLRLGSYDYDYQNPTYLTIGHLDP